MVIRPIHKKKAGHIWKNDNKAYILKKADDESIYGKTIARLIYKKRLVIRFIYGRIVAKPIYRKKLVVSPIYKKTIARSI